MSNETDLDWLARNVHKWPAGEHQPWCYVYWKGGRRAVSGNCITVIQPCVRIEKSDWLTRRAELQNKPGWAGAPEWAGFLSQNCIGLWCFTEFMAWPNDAGGWSMQDRSGRRHAIKVADGEGGLVLGDWRDTLERRTADTTWQLDVPVEHIKLNVHVIGSEEVKPVSVSNETVPLEQPAVVAGTGVGMSIGEWAAKYSGRAPSDQIREAVINEALGLLREHADHLAAQELAELHDLCDAELTKRDAAVCGGQKYLDATWFERGALPPVGAECEIFLDGSWERVFIAGVSRAGEPVAEFGPGNIVECVDCKYRPIRTERDVMIEHMQSDIAERWANCEELATHLVDKGWVKESK